MPKKPKKGFLSFTSTSKPTSDSAANPAPTSDSAANPAPTPAPSTEKPFTDEQMKRLDELVESIKKDLGKSSEKTEETVKEVIEKVDRVVEKVEKLEGVDPAGRSLYARLNGEPDSYMQVYAVRMHGDEPTWYETVPSGTILKDAAGCAYVTATEESDAVEIADSLEPDFKHDTALKKHVWCLNGQRRKFFEPFAVASLIYE